MFWGHTYIRAVYVLLFVQSSEIRGNIATCAVHSDSFEFFKQCLSQQVGDLLKKSHIFQVLQINGSVKRSFSLHVDNTILIEWLSIWLSRVRNSSIWFDEGPKTFCFVFCMNKLFFSFTCSTIKTFYFVFSSLDVSICWKIQAVSSGRCPFYTRSTRGVRC